MNDTDFSKLETPKFTIRLNNANNAIEYDNRVLIIEKMTRVEDQQNVGVMFCGCAYKQHLKRPVYGLANGWSSLQVNEFILDMTEPEKEENFVFFASEDDIKTKLSKLMKIPLAEEPNDLIFVELLHSKGMFVLTNL